MPTLDQELLAWHPYTIRWQEVEPDGTHAIPCVRARSWSTQYIT
jgi:hypothetical protein